MLRVNDLRVQYGRIPALHGVDIEVHPGEIVSVIGPNGAGKSSLLNTISGSVRPAEGTITFEDRGIGGLAPETIVRRGISLVPEGRRIFTKLTVAENLQLGGSARQRNKELGDDVESMLDLFPILRIYHRTSAGKLSGGEQQMLAIARAMLAKPRLLMLDEPSLGLAPIVIDQVFNTLVELRALGTTVLLVEQNARRAIELADRTYVLRSGVIELTGSRDEILANERLEAAFLGFDLAPLEVMVESPELP